MKMTAPPDFSREVYCLLGLPFDAIDLMAATRHIRNAALNRTPCFLTTANVNFLVASQTDPNFRDSVIHSDLSVADGMPLIWLARILNIPLTQRVAGSDLFDALRHEQDSPLSVFFFGGPDGVAQAACLTLSAESKGLTCAGFESPGFGSIEDMSSIEVLQRINASGAHLLVVSLGARKGQAWIERNRAKLDIPIISHLGAVVNFVAGTTHRAPRSMQYIGLEWLWRILEEPMLWHRYLWDALALITLMITRILPYAWHLRLHKTNPKQLASARVQSEEDDQNCVIRLQGAWTQLNLGPLRNCFLEATQTGKNLKLDLSNVTYIDSAFVGLVMLLHGYQAQHGSQFLIVSPSKPVLRVLRFCCAEYLCSDPIPKFHTD